jgi:hypothetical protein
VILLVSVTALPIWSAWSTGRDLLTGPVERAGSALVLPYTGRVLQK